MTINQLDQLITDNEIIEIGNEMHRAMPVGADDQQELLAICREVLSVFVGKLLEDVVLPEPVELNPSANSVMGYTRQQVIDILASTALKLSVTNIMVRVVPGHDGGGEEVYAKSVEEVQDLLSKLSLELDDLKMSQLKGSK